MLDKTEEMVKKKPRGGSLDAILLIVIGFIFLLNNLGILSWEVWTVLWKFWPVILILAGVEITLGKSTLGRLMTMVIILAVIALVFTLAAAPNSPAIDRFLKKNFPKLQENFS